MRIFIVLMFTLLSGTAFCQTQLQMNENAAKQYRQADKTLNEVYNAILKKHKTDAAFIRNLKATQKIWIQFRDAELKTKYPVRPKGHYGSIQPVCEYDYLTELTTERTNKLRQWIDGIEEGDACGGTLPVK